MGSNPTRPARIISLFSIRQRSQDARAEMEALRGIAGLSELVDLERLPGVIEAIEASGTGVVPTMVLWESGILPTRPSSELKAERPEIRYMPEETVARWTEAVDSGLERYGVENTERIAALRRQILGDLNDAGANILLGTDSPRTSGSLPGETGPTWSCSTGIRSKTSRQLGRSPESSPGAGT